MQQSVLITSIIGGLIGLAIVGYAAFVFVRPEQAIAPVEEIQQTADTSDNSSYVEEPLLIPKKAGTAPANSATSSSSTTATTTATTTSAPQTISLAEVAKHATASDCWMVLNGKVYNLTSYISKHPAGKSILRGCGRDDTAGFARVDEHSGPKIDTLLTSYFIGYVAQ
ncbi:MAG: cytochrome b5 domain-containing protein [Candidatus Yonathbacteria bacterium]|nr:cytochrome b5 domain-containing protein [Candidatus Yonathbacteria bacterium]